MSDQSTEQLLHELSQDLPRVRPIPRVRSAFAGCVGMWGIALALMWAFGGLRGEVFRASSWSDPQFVTVFAGLALLAIGATLTALAGAVPGREAAARGSSAIATLGIGIAAGGGLWAVVAAGAKNDATGAWMCLSGAGALAFLPVLVASLFLARGVVQRPRLGAGLAVCGAVALGALVIHMSCRMGGGLHVLLGHAMAPLFLGFVLAVPLAALIRHWGRSR